MYNFHNFIYSLIILTLLFFGIVYSQSNNQTLAVLPFKNSSMDNKHNNLVNGIPDMLMTNLGDSKKIKLVERVQIEKALNHFQIEQIGIIDESKAIQVGQWIGASWLLLGNFSSINSNVRIDCRIVDVKEGTLLKSTKVTGSIDETFTLVDNLASQILDVFTGETISFRNILLDKEYKLFATDEIFFYVIEGTIMHKIGKIIYDNGTDGITVGYSDAGDYGLKKLTMGYNIYVKHTNYPRYLLYANVGNSIGYFTEKSMWVPIEDIDENTILKYLIKSSITVLDIGYKYYDNKKFINYMRVHIKIEIADKRNIRRVMKR